MNINTKDLSFINFNNEEMQWVKFNGVTVYEAWRTLIASGIPPLTLAKCKGVDLIDYKIYGESIQDGTPTPETPMEILSVGEKTVNLFNNLTIDDNTKLSYGNPTSSDDRYTSSYIDCENISTISINLGASFAWYDADKNIVSYENKSVTMFRTYTKPEGAKYLRVDFDKSVITSDQVMIVDGKYTADTMPEYEPYGKYKVPVEVSGRNLFDYSTLLDNGYIDILDEKKGEFVFVLNSGIPATYIQAKENFSYFISYKVKVVREQTIMLNVYYTDGTNKNITVNNGVIGEYVSVSGTTDVNKTIDYIKFGGAGGLETGTCFKELQISEINSSYEPYYEPVTTNIYLDEPLRKVGDYADYIDFVKQKVVRNTTKYTFDNTEGVDVSRTGDINQSYYIASPTLSAINIKRDEPLYSDILSYQNNVQNVDTIQEVYLIGYGGNRLFLYIQVPLNLATTVDEVKNLLNGKEIFGVALTPAEETFELPKIPTHKGTTILEIDTNILPSNMEVVYKGR